MGIFRTIFGKFWRIKKYPKICKPRFFLSIRHLVSGLKTRVFRTERGVSGFQMLIFDIIVKTFYPHFFASEVFRQVPSMALKTDWNCIRVITLSRRMSRAGLVNPLRRAEQSAFSTSRKVYEKREHPKECSLHHIGLGKN
jgi:hypothetical protein